MNNITAKIAVLAAALCFFMNNPSVSGAAVLPSCGYSHLTSAIEASDGSIWITAENGGVKRLRNGKWNAYTAADGLADTRDFTCVCEDLQGRIWVGTVDSGVSVFNGKHWKKYNIVNGPLSSRIYSIACSPENGTVALGHSFGVAIYIPETDTWREIGAFEGLPNKPVCAVTFSNDGTLWAAYDDSGLAAINFYEGMAKVTKRIVTDYTFGKNRISHVPLSGKGDGLPSKLMNAVAANEDRIFCGTVSGFAYSLNKGCSWHYIRGTEWLEKINGLRAELSVKKTKYKNDELIVQDFVTSILPHDGKVWIGTRSKGACVFDPNTTKCSVNETITSSGAVHISSLFKTHSGAVMAACYGEGLKVISGTFVPYQENSNGGQSAVSFPSDAQPLSEKEIKKIEAAITSATIFKGNEQWGAYLKEDWETRGNWIGRYGKWYSELCAGNVPLGSKTYIFEKPYITPRKILSPSIWRFKNTTDILRSWLHWKSAEDNPNVLFNITSFHRKETEWDDHGEAYPQTADGPDIWLIFSPPAKDAYKISFYFFSPNNRDGQNGERDYLIELYDFNGTASDLPDYEKIIASNRVLARARAHFLGTGVYKDFVVNGTKSSIFRISRNYSFNTILNGIFIEKFEIPFSPDKEDKDASSARAIASGFPLSPGNFSNISVEDIPEKACVLWKLSESLSPSDFSVNALSNMRANLYRASAVEKCDPIFLNHVKWRIPVWTNEEKKVFFEEPLKFFLARQDFYPGFRSRKEFKYSPGTIDFSVEEILKMDELKIDWKQYRKGGAPDVSEEEMHKLLAKYTLKKSKGKYIGFSRTEINYKTPDIGKMIKKQENSKKIKK